MSRAFKVRVQGNEMYFVLFGLVSAELEMKYIEKQKKENIWRKLDLTSVNLMIITSFFNDDS